MPMSTIRTQMRRFRALAILLLVIVAGLVVFILSRQNTGIAIPESNLFTVNTRNVRKEVTAEGNLAGLDTRNVIAPAGAEISELRVGINTSVSAGQELAVLLVNGRSVVVKSPIAGNVTRSNYKVKDIVVATNPIIFEVSDLQSYRIPLGVNESDIIDIAVDQQVELTFPALSLGDSYPGKVEYVSPSPLNTTGAVNYEVVVRPTTLPEKVRLGMSVDVVIIAAQVNDVIAVPENYLVEKDSNYFVKVVSWDSEDKRSYTLSEREVVTGLITDEYVEIKTGLKVGETIVDPGFTIQRAFRFF